MVQNVGKCSHKTASSTRCVTYKVPASVRLPGLRYMTLSQEAETGGAALHDKWQSGHICTAVMPKNRYLLEDHGDHCRTTDELCSTISIGEGSVMASVNLICVCLCIVVICGQENQLDNTQRLTVLVICCTCFGHLYAHCQELETICRL
jgi:hypothetical protein